MSRSPPKYSPRLIPRYFFRFSFSLRVSYVTTQILNDYNQFTSTERRKKIKTQLEKGTIIQEGILIFALRFFISNLFAAHPKTYFESLTSRTLSMLPHLLFLGFGLEKEKHPKAVW